jgi:hypothetical protein
MRIAAFFAALLLLTPSVTNQAVAQSTVPSLDWRVEKRYRLVAADPVDRVLEVLSRDGATLGQNYDLLTATFGGANWEQIATALDEVYTVDRSPKARRAGEYRRSYLQPQNVIVSVLAEGLDGKCAWTVDGAPGIASDGRPLSAVPCVERQRLRIERKSDRIAAVLAVRSDSGQILPPQTIQVDNEIIAGLGDSYGSGEGNPDLPVTLKYGPPPPLGAQRRHAETANWYDGLAGQNPNVGPTWLDPACHRSLLSNQVLATLRYAAQNPHKVVTFVALACSGASVFDGVLTPKTDAKLHPIADAQVTVLQRLLCDGEPNRMAAEPIRPSGFVARARRGQPNLLPPVEICVRNPVKISKVLLSVGGNDIGFGGLITWGVLPSKGWSNKIGAQLMMDFVNSHAQLVCPYQTEPRCRDALSAKTTIDELRAGYEELGRVLLKAGIAPEKVVLAAYPNPLMSGASTSSGMAYHCPLYRKHEYDRERAEQPEDYLGYRRSDPIVVSPGLDAVMTRVPPRLRKWQLWLTENEEVQVQEYVLKPLWAQMRASAAGQKWTYVDTYVGETEPHGWCALDKPMPGVHALTVLGPVSQAQLTYPIEAGQPFRPYVQRGRWFRTINDSYLTQFTTKHGKVQADTWTGAFHPTAELHAVMADALAEALGKPPI